MPKLKPYLRRFEYLALKDKSPGTDPAQVPAAATIDFFAPGAFIGTAPLAPITPNDPDPTVVHVWDTGSIQVGDQLAYGASTQARFVVNSIPDTTHLEISALQSTTLAVGDRLVRLAGRPTLYSDPYGAAALGSSSITCSAANGRASCYPGIERFDYVVSGGGGDRKGRP